MELGGKKALVFGGTSGIGLSASELLRDSGVEVVAISRDPSRDPVAATLRQPSRESFCERSSVRYPH